ncbi:MAG: response regulator transcription factor [Lachnospiraceae bacterium]|nr:response regulator transcription factor [Lachnospiraceae bacterium]
MNTGLKVLVVDDENMIRDAVSAYFEKMGCSILQADNGLSALEIYEKEQVGFIILDLMLPGLSGEEVCKKIREKSDVPIIMLTARTMEDDIINGLDLGADDYVTKPFSVKELYARMNVVLRRYGKKPEESSEIVFKGGLAVSTESGEVRKGEEIISLTKSELKILSSMIRYPKKIFTREELLEIVFGEESESFDRVIDTHIKNLRKKIEDDPKNSIYIRTVHGLGYKFGGERADEKDSP